jgi:hypothetical protein
MDDQLTKLIDDILADKPYDEQLALPLLWTEAVLQKVEYELADEINELHGKGSLEKIHDYHNDAHDVARAAGNRKKAGRHLTKAGRASDLIDLRAATQAFHQAKRNLKASKQFAKGSRLMQKKETE